MTGARNTTTTTAAPTHAQARIGVQWRTMTCINQQAIVSTTGFEVFDAVDHLAASMQPVCCSYR
jgi:hypothetical protein